jgi:hypothetical protein
MLEVEFGVCALLRVSMMSAFFSGRRKGDVSASGKPLFDAMCSGGAASFLAAKAPNSMSFPPNCETTGIPRPAANWASIKRRMTRQIEH